MQTRTTIYGHITSHDETVSGGMYYLTRQLSEQEAKVFFDQAYNRGFAMFEDHMGHNYKLIHSGSEYKLVKA